MTQRSIVLASQSAHRKMLLEQIGIADFTVTPSDYEEDHAADVPPHVLVMQLALGKAQDVAQRYDDAIVIGGDTLITFDGAVIGKPRDADDARETLLRFSGKRVGAVSGFAVIDTKTGMTITDYGEGGVYFRDLALEDIDAYIATSEPLTLAGSFGVLKRAALFADRYDGDFFSIVGLPLAKLRDALRACGADPLTR